MIFATTGTHPQPMERLVVWLDEWAEECQEEVVVQMMHTQATPKHLTLVTCVTPQRWRELVQGARVVISHAGPASLFEIQGLGKTPVVVPRSASFDEHVDDHQERYAKTLGPDVPVVWTRHALRDRLVEPPAPCLVPDRSQLQREASAAVEGCTARAVSTASIGVLGRTLRTCFWR